jgi:hypothetical protein
MKRSVFLFFLIINIIQSFAQFTTKPIEIKKNIIGSTYFKQNNRVLKPRQLFKVATTDEVALKEIQIARNNYRASMIFGLTGGIIAVGTFTYVVFYLPWIAAGFNEPTWLVPMAVGIGLIITSIPFGIAFNKHIKNAVNIYNDGLEQSELKKIELQLGIINNGVGLRLKF